MRPKKSDFLPLLVKIEKCVSGVSLDTILVRTADVRSMMLEKYNELVHDGSSDDDPDAKRLEAATAVEHDLYGDGNPIERPELVPYVLLLWKRLDYSKESVLNDVIRRTKTLYERPCQQPAVEVHDSPETDTLPERSVSHLVNSGMSAKQADDLVRKPMKMAWLKGGGAAGRWAAITALAGTTLVAGFLHP